jgi:hypothetical protein
MTRPLLLLLLPLPPPQQAMPWMQLEQWMMAKELS